MAAPGAGTTALASPENRADLIREWQRRSCRIGRSEAVVRRQRASGFGKRLSSRTFFFPGGGHITVSDGHNVKCAFETPPAPNAH